MSIAALEHPAVWTGDEIKMRCDWSRDFSAVNPAAIRDQLENGSGVVLLRGFPLAACDKDSAREAFVSWCSDIGTAVSQNEKGSRVFDVSDSGFGKEDPRTRGPNTNKKLSFHTDRCDVIAFLCWKQAREGGENELVSSMALSNQIREERPDLLEVLREPFLYKRHSVDLGNDLATCEQPIFSFCEDRFACSFLRVLINRGHDDPELPNLSDLQIEAMDFLEEVAGREENIFRFRQEPGDVLLLNNWVTLHRRTAFEDFEEADQKRCLFRVWLSMSNSRPLDPAFEANYGSVSAGAIRGGMRPADS